MKLKELENNSILILGFGREGKDTYSFLRKIYPDKILAIADQKIDKKGKNLKVFSGKNYLSAISKYSIIIKSPGISFELIEPYLSKGQKVTSQTEIFINNYPGEIIGVTGTKGKGTTVSLIYHILQEAGLNVRIGGNIGKPVLQSLLTARKGEIFVYEMSSHQLKNLKRSPHIAVFLNLFPAHLNFFKDYKDYKRSKENIALYQTEKDFFIYNSDYKELKELAKKTKAKKIAFNNYKGIIPKKDIPLVGNFNLLNVTAAALVAKLYKVPIKDIRQAVKSFKPLPHRLEFVKEYKGIKFYNDSLATVPEATIAGIEAFNGKLKTLILGGQHIPGIDFSRLAKKIIEEKVETLIFLPETGKEIYKEVLKYGKPKTFFVNSMKQAVETAYKHTKNGVCLLSPTAPSFNLFKDYKERGDLFKEFVKDYE